MIKFGIIGYGYWGPNLVRNFNGNKNFQIVKVADSRQERLDLLENIAFLTVNFASGMIAHFNCSWSAPVKIRLMLIGGDKKMIVFNDLEPTEKIKIYDTGYNVKTDEEKQRLLVDYRTGDIFIPKTPSTEALALMAEDFAQAILNKQIPVANFNSGLAVIKILEAASRSLKDHGKEIIIK